MSAERARSAHAIFTRALGQNPAEREGFVRASCAGDEALAAMVQRLLAASEMSTGFLSRPALDAARETQHQTPDAVGNYLVIGILGVGGMATVYEALQENPSRRVALKVMHRGMSNTDAYLRFRLETETLARLHHPGIAQIYEAGTAQLGQPSPTPFFAMELIPDALPITRYAEKHGLSLRQRLEMFASVCDAVLHGHQNGVIHRDIKPANVLVGPDGVAKVIDFGIARSTTPGDSSLTLAQGGSGFIGTLQYMSPEQCDSAAKVDIRTDVYSLGVMLFELVTGRLPIDIDGKPLPEAIRLIAEAPHPPAHHFKPAARGDLTAIISVATEKDPSRRYSGADALAADIRRSLADLPIEARPSGALGQLRKFARRNRPLAVALAVALCALLSGAAVSAWFAVDATRARDAALLRGQELETVVAFQESLLADVDPAEMGLNLRRMLREEVLRGPSLDSDDLETFDRLTRSVNYTSLGVRTLHESILRNYEASISQRFADQPLLRARLLQQLAETMNSLGLHAESESILRTALDLRRAGLGNDHPDTLQTEHALGSLLSVLSRHDESLPLLRRVHEARARTLGPESRATLRAAASVAGTLRRAGHSEEAERIWTETLAAQRRTLGDDDPDTLRTLNNIGVLYVTTGRPDLAEASWRELMERRRRILGEDHPDYRGSLGNLGVLLQDQGRLAEARDLIEAAVANDRRRYGDRHSLTLTSIGQLAGLHTDLGQLDEAERLQRECYEGRMIVLGPDHGDTIRAKALLAKLVLVRGHAAQAADLLREVIDSQKRILGPGHPDLAVSLNFLAEVMLAQGDTAQALDLNEQAIRINDGAQSYELGLGGKLRFFRARILHALGRGEEALPLYLEAHAAMERELGPGNPHVRAAASRIAECYQAAHAATPGKGHDALARQWLARAAPEAAESPTSNETVTSP